MSKAASAFNDHKRKALIRKSWCKPQLQNLASALNSKLVYLGLPDIEGLDILEWLEYIEKVIAFQCSSYNGQQIDVKKLDRLLQDLERRQKIKSGFVYQGFMEDIVMGGVSERGDTFSQSDFLRVYNLDFCNNLKTPREVRNARGKVIQIIYKTDAIKKLLEHQANTSHGGNGNFIMYLTVNAQTFRDDGGTVKDPDIKKYLKMISKIRKPEVKAAREMKAYCYYTLRSIFDTQGFHAEFLPPVYYMGSGYPNRETGKMDNHRMMTFTILGSRKAKDEVSFAQNTSTFLNQKFIFATDTKISPYIDSFVDEIDCEHDSETLIKSSQIYTSYWRRKLS